MEIEEVRQYIREIKLIRKKLEQHTDDSPGTLMRRVQLLTQLLEYMGRVSAHMDGEYKRTEAKRKNTYAEVKRTAKRGDKENDAEFAIRELRIQEAEAYEHMHLWRNELSSVTEHLHELRLRLRIDLNAMSGGGI